MKKVLLFFTGLILFFSISTYAQLSTEEELTNLLHEFLKGASVNDAEMHDRFWAEDLIYTSSSGQRFGKEHIMAGFEGEQEQTNDIPNTIYSAEDIRIQQYGDMAILAFRLVSKTETADGVQTEYYLNSGTLLKRNGQWKVVNWQATKVPRK